MRLIKYDKLNNTAKSSSSSSSSSSNTYIGDNNIARSIWGQYDNGEDVDGSMIVNGNVIIKEIGSSYGEDYDEEDDNDEDDIADDAEEGGGNLNVEFKITSNETESNDIYVKQHLYIPHPETKVKTDIVDLLKGYNSRITTNSTNIANNSTNIQNNADEIEKLKKSVITEDRIKELISQNTSSSNGSSTNPIILFSGKAYRATSLTYSVNGIQIPKFILTASIKDGLMTLTITPNVGVKVNVYSVNVTQLESAKTSNITTTSIQNRNSGAHWFEARPDNNINTQRIYIREFHQANGNNDSWDSTTWFQMDDGISAVNITIIGYITEE